MRRIFKGIWAVTVVLGSFARWNRVLERMCLLSNVVGCREPLPSKAVVLLSRASGPPSAAHQLRSGCVGLLVQILRVAVRPGDRQTGDFDRLAPQGVQALLEVEIPIRPPALAE